MSWASSNRRDRLPRDWPKRRARVLKRDPICKCSGCRHHYGPCRAPSSEVDHVVRGDDHRLENLAGKCKRCHATKTGHEGQAARPPRRRPLEQHPGLSE